MGEIKERVERLRRLKEWVKNNRIDKNKGVVERIDDISYILEELIDEL